MSIMAKDFELTAEEQDEIMRLATHYKRGREVLQRRHIAGCVLLAAMEALLLSTANCFQGVMSAKYAAKSRGKVKRLDKWGLADLLKVADELDWLPAGLSPSGDWSNAKAKIGDYVDIVRRIRNFIHPIRYAGDFGRRRITKKYYESCFNILDAAADRLFEIVKASLK
jgi:hypothetical protein